MERWFGAGKVAIDVLITGPSFWADGLQAAAFVQLLRGNNPKICVLCYGPKGMSHHGDRWAGETAEAIMSCFGKLVWIEADQQCQAGADQAIRSPAVSSYNAERWFCSAEGAHPSLFDVTANTVTVLSSCAM